MYVYRTTTFDEQVAEKTGLGDHVDRLCGELARMTLEQVLARFERVYPYLKRKEGNLRLIARIRRVGSDPVLCWLKVFRRGDRAYEEFLRDRENFADRVLDSQIKQEQLWQWLNRRKTENDRQKAPPLSQAFDECFSPQSADPHSSHAGKPQLQLHIYRRCKARTLHQLRCRVLPQANGHAVYAQALVWYENRLTGDADDNGNVDFTDFLLFSDNVGKRIDSVWKDGDFDGDGSVDFADFLLLSQNFGNHR